MLKLKIMTRIFSDGVFSPGTTQISKVNGNTVRRSNFAILILPPFKIGIYSYTPFFFTFQHLLSQTTGISKVNFPDFFFCIFP